MTAAQTAYSEATARWEVAKVSDVILPTTAPTGNITLAGEIDVRNAETVSKKGYVTVENYGGNIILGTSETPAIIKGTAVTLTAKAIEDVIGSIEAASVNINTNQGATYGNITITENNGEGSDNQNQISLSNANKYDFEKINESYTAILNSLSSDDRDAVENEFMYSLASAIESRNGELALEELAGVGIKDTAETTNSIIANSDSEEDVALCVAATGNISLENTDLMSNGTVGIEANKITNLSDVQGSTIEIATQEGAVIGNVTATSVDENGNSIAIFNAVPEESIEENNQENEQQLQIEYLRLIGPSSLRAQDAETEQVGNDIVINGTVKAPVEGEDAGRDINLESAPKATEPAKDTPEIKLFLKKVQFTDSEILDEKVLLGIAEKYEGREVVIGDLYTICDEVNRIS